MAACRPPFHLVVSDGRRWWWHDKGSPPHLVNKPLGTNLARDYRTSFARAGVLLPTLPLPPGRGAGPADHFPVTAFRLGPAERVGGREARRVDYDLFVEGQTQPNGGPMPFPVQLWLDAETSLPIKRVVMQRLVDGSGKARTGVAITETYQKAVSATPSSPRHSSCRRRRAKRSSSRERDSAAGTRRFPPELCPGCPAIPSTTVLPPL